MTAILKYADGTERTIDLSTRPHRVKVPAYTQTFNRETGKVAIGITELIFERVHASRPTYRQIVPLAAEASQVPA